MPSELGDAPRRRSRRKRKHKTSPSPTRASSFSEKDANLAKDLEKKRKKKRKNKRTSSVNPYEVDGASVTPSKLAERLEEAGYSTSPPSLLNRIPRGKQTGISKRSNKTIRILQDFKFSGKIAEINLQLAEGKHVEAHKEFSVNMLQSIMEMLPILEESFRVKQKTADVYALKALIELASDLMDTLTSEETDNSKMYKDVYLHVMMPSFLGLGKTLLLSNDLLVSALSPYTTCSTKELKKILDDSTKSNITYIDTLSSQIDDKLRSVFKIK